MRPVDVDAAGEVLVDAAEVGDRAPAAEHRGVGEHGALVGAEAVEPGGHQPPQRVGQGVQLGRGAPRRRASAASRSPTSATSSSRKNGLPPLRSSSASRTSSGSDQPTSDSSSSEAAGASSGSRLTTMALWRPGPRVPALADALPGGGDEHVGPAGEPLEQHVDQLDDRGVGPVQVGQLDDDRLVGRRRLDEGHDRLRRPPRGRSTGRRPAARPRSRAGGGCRW